MIPVRATLLVLACIAGTLCALAQSWLLACLLFCAALCGCHLTFQRGQRLQRRLDEVTRG